MPNCAACGSSQVEFVPEASADICRLCGTLADPAQIDLRGQSPDPTTGSLVGLTWYGGPTLLKTANGRRVLQGQSNKEASDRRNTMASHEYINNLLSTMVYTGLSVRAKNIFDACYRTGQFRWGKTATLVAGASVYIVLRESKKLEMLKEIAARISYPPAALSKVFLRVNTIIQPTLPPSEASAHIPSLIKLIPTLTSPTSRTPRPLRTYLSTTSFPAVQSLASSLYTFVRRVSLTHNRQAAPVSCALLIMSLEGESRKALPSLGLVAEFLAKHTGVHKNTVLERYHEMGLMIEDLKSCLPWVIPISPATTAKKTSKRRMVDRADNAKWIKDVLKFQEDVFAGSDDAELEEDDDETEGNSRHPPCDTSSMSSGASSSSTTRLSSVVSSSSDSTHARKKRRIHLDQTSARPSAYVNPTPCRHAKYERELENAVTSLFGTHSALTARTCTARRNEPSPQAQLLTSQFTANCARPTRVQALGAFKGECNVSDDELFGDGELEALLRSEDEVLEAEEYWDQVHGPEEEDDNNAIRPSKPTTSRKRARGYLDLDLLDQFGITQDLIDNDQEKGTHEAVQEFAGGFAGPDFGVSVGEMQMLGGGDKDDSCYYDYYSD